MDIYPEGTELIITNVCATQTSLASGKKTWMIFHKNRLVVSTGIYTGCTIASGKMVCGVEVFDPQQTPSYYVIPMANVGFAPQARLSVKKWFELASKIGSSTERRPKSIIG